MATTVRRRARAPLLLAAVATWLIAPAVPAQMLSGTELVDVLQGGGCVLVIRNAQSPEERTEDAPRSPANHHGEREIDAYGQGQMSVIGYAFRELDIPVGQTLSGPAYRSRQSANYLGFGKQSTVNELDEDADPSWLEQRVAEAPAAGQNTVIVTHGGLIAAALGQPAREIGTAETLIYCPDAGGAAPVARLTIEDWARLAVN